MLKDVKLADILHKLSTALQNESSVEDLASEILDALPSPSSRSFSSIDSGDIPRMNLVLVGSLEEVESFKEEAMSEHFLFVISAIETRWDLKSETSRRTLIDVFLLSAFGTPSDVDRSVVFPEMLVSSINATDSFKFHGYIDYVIALSGNGKLTLRKKALGQGLEPPEKPFCTVVEAKKDQSFADGVAQTLAEMKALWALNAKVEENSPAITRDIYGVLSDSDRWQFLILGENGKEYFISRIYHRSADSQKIYTILKEFVYGKSTLLTKV